MATIEEEPSYGGKSIEEIWNDYNNMKLDFEESQLLIRELDEQIYEKDQQVESMIRKQDDMRDEIEEMEEELAHKDLELQSSRKRENEAIRKMNKYRSKLKNLNEEVTDDEVELFDEAEVRSPPPPSPREDTKDDSDDENENWRLRHELNEALIVIESQEQELDEKSHLIQNLRQQQQPQDDGDGTTQQLRDDLSECKRLIADQDQELADREDEIELLEEKLAQAIATTKEGDIGSNDNVASMKERLSTAKSQLERMSQRSTARRQKTERRPTEITSSDHQGSQSSLSSNSSDGSKISTRQYERLKEQVYDALKIIEDQELDLESRDVKIQELQRQLADGDDAENRLTAEDGREGQPSLQDYEQRLQERDLSIEILEGSLEDMNTELEDARKAILFEQRKGLKRSNDLQQKIDEKDGVIQTMIKTVETLQKDNNNLKAEKAKAKAEHGGRRSSMAMSTKGRFSIAPTTAGFFQRIARGGGKDDLQELDKNAEQVDVLEDQLAVKTDQITSMEAEFSSLKKQLEAAQAKNRRYKMHAQKLAEGDEAKHDGNSSSELWTMQEDYDALLEELDEKQEIVVDLEAKLAAAKEQESQMESVQQEYKMEQQVLEERLNHTRDIANGLKDELQESRKKLELREQDAAELNEKLLTTQMELEAANEEIQSNEENISKMKGELWNKIDRSPSLSVSKQESDSVEKPEVDQEDNSDDTTFKAIANSASPDRPSWNLRDPSYAQEPSHASPDTASSASIAEAFKNAEESFEIESAALQAFATEVSEKSQVKKIKELQRELKGAKRKIEDLRAYSTALDDELLAKDGVIKELQTSDLAMGNYISSLEDKEQESQQKLTELKISITKLQAELDKDHVEQQLGGMTTEPVASIKMQSKLKKAENALEEATNSNIDLEDKLTASENTISELNGMVDQLKHEMGGSTLERTGALEETAVLKSEVTSLKKDLSKETAKVEDLQGTVEDLHKQLLDAVSAKEAVMASKLADREDTITELKKKVDQLEGDLAEAAEATKAALNKSAAVKSEWQIVQERKDALKRELDNPPLASTYGNMPELLLQLQEAQAAIEETKNENKALKARLAAREDTVVELKDMLDQLEDDLADATQDTNAGEIEKIKKTRGISPLQDKKEQRTFTNKMGSESHLKAARNDLEEANKDRLEEAKMESSSANETELLLQQSKLDLKEAANQKAKLENKLSASEDAIEELKDMVDRLEEDLADASEARSAALEETSALKADLEKAQEEKEVTKQMLEEAKMESSS
ncbi:unnamed protein product, partial [Cylindrotheca closterium]